MSIILEYFDPATNPMVAAGIFVREDIDDEEEDEDEGDEDDAQDEEEEDDDGEGYSV